MHATRTSGSEVHSPKRCTWLIFQLRGCSFHFLFPLWIHFLFFFDSRHEWHCTKEGKKIFLLSSTLQALTTSTGSQKLALLTLPGSPWTDLNTEPHHLFSIKGCCTKRDLYIVRNHGGRSEDTGWLDTASTNCNWEGKYPESTAFNRRPILPSHALVRENEGSW